MDEDNIDVAMENGQKEDPSSEMEEGEVSSSEDESEEEEDQSMDDEDDSEEEESEEEEEEDLDDGTKTSLQEEGINIYWCYNTLLKFSHRYCGVYWALDNT